jgi:hypothetical protein
MPIADSRQGAGVKRWNTGAEDPIHSIAFHPIPFHSSLPKSSNIRTPKHRTASHPDLELPVTRNVGSRCHRTPSLVNYEKREIPRRKIGHTLLSFHLSQRREGGANTAFRSRRQGPNKLSRKSLRSSGTGSAWGDRVERPLLRTVMPEPEIDVII